VLLLSLPIFSCAAEKTVCPPFFKENNNVLVGARLFDGPLADKVELVPDNENNATWDIRGYQKTDRVINLVCDYKNGDFINVPAQKSSDRCYVKGEKPVTAWCGK
jgi:hypothetical protein